MAAGPALEVPQFILNGPGDISRHKNIMFGISIRLCMWRRETRERTRHIDEHDEWKITGCGWTNFFSSLFFSGPNKMGGSLVIIMPPRHSYYIFFFALLFAVSSCVAHMLSLSSYNGPRDLTLYMVSGPLAPVAPFHCANLWAETPATGIEINWIKACRIALVRVHFFFLFLPDKKQQTYLIIMHVATFSWGRTCIATANRDIEDQECCFISTGVRLSFYEFIKGEGNNYVFANVHFLYYFTNEVLFNENAIWVKIIFTFLGVLFKNKT